MSEIKRQPFWENSYKRIGDKLDTFYGGKPAPDVVAIASQLPLDSKILDLGCGEGKNAAYLADLGFEVTAVDISESGINKLKEFALKMKLVVESSVCDMRQFDFSTSYDLIINHSCLQYMPREDWKKLVQKMKDATNVGGFNIIDVFTDEVPEPEDQRGMMMGLFKSGELTALYEDWKTLEFRPYQIEHTHPNGPTHRHAGENLIAQRIK
jgi:tellurite methyltransferase